MTYLATNRPRARQRYGKRPGRIGVGNAFFDFVDHMINPVEAALRPIACRDQARLEVAGIDAQVAEAERWSPTGFFTPGDIETVILTVINMRAQVRNEMAEQPNFDLDNDDHSDLLAGLSLPSQQPFMTAVIEARKSGARVINAPGLKHFVVESLKNVRKASLEVAFLDCNMSAFERFVRAVNAAVDKVLEVLKVIVGIVVKAGELVVDALDTTFQLFKFAKYAVLFGGGAYLLFKLKQMRDRS